MGRFRVCAVELFLLTLTAHLLIFPFPLGKSGCFFERRHFQMTLLWSCNGENAVFLRKFISPAHASAGSEHGLAEDLFRSNIQPFLILFHGILADNQ